MNYFDGCRDLETARKHYLKLVKLNHPDKGGRVEVMQEINNQYDSFKKHGRVVENESIFNRSYTSSTRDRNSFNMDAAWDFINREMGKQKAYYYYSTDYSGAAWNEDIEREANTKESKAEEKLKARKEKLREEIKAKKAQAKATFEKVAEEARKMQDQQAEFIKAQMQGKWDASGYTTYEESDPVKVILDKEYRRIAKELNKLISSKIEMGKYKQNLYGMIYEIIEPSDIKKILETK